jgi:hypothetical protein
VKCRAARHAGSYSDEKESDEAGAPVTRTVARSRCSAGRPSGRAGADRTYAAGIAMHGHHCMFHEVSGHRSCRSGSGLRRSSRTSSGPSARSMRAMSALRPSFLEAFRRTDSDHLSGLGTKARPASARWRSRRTKCRNGRGPRNRHRDSDRKTNAISIESELAADGYEILLEIRARSRWRVPRRCRLRDSTRCGWAASLSSLGCGARGRRGVGLV